MDIDRTNHRLMKCLEWEENGYHDSYFYAVYWDVDAQEAFSREIGATAYPGGIQNLPTISWDEEQIEKARQWHEDKIFDKLVEAEQQDVMTPNTIEKGNRVQLLKKHRNKVKQITEVPCGKCNGEGKWVNPRNSADERECFGCHGLKVIKKRGEPLKDETGKQVYDKFAPGVTGTVTWVGTFRTIYANGYNKLNRATLSCRVDTDDGRTLMVPLEKLRLEREPLSNEVLRQRAKVISYDMNFKPHFSRHQGWLSSNTAKAYLNQVGGVCE